MRTAHQRLLGFAHKRVASAPSPSLVTHVRRTLVPRADLLEGPLVPWDMSVGRFTDTWADLRDEERLALNHWLYFLHYLRIADGERFVIVANEVIATFVRPVCPVVAAMLDRENLEEWDHIAAFDEVRERVAAHWGYAAVPFPKKPLRKVFVDPRFVSAIVRWFGADYVVLHFLARGIINHMGRGYEKPIAQMGSESAVSALSALHVEDETRHTAASHLLAEAGRDLGPTPERTLIYGAFAWLLRRGAAWSLFDERVTKRQESAMTRRALAAMPAFSRRDAPFLDRLVDDHFRAVSGVERAKNEDLAGPNRTIVDRAAVDASDRRAWVAWIRRRQGNLRHFPEDYAP